MADYRILRDGVKETTRLDERQQFVPVRTIRFMVGEHGPFVVMIDARDFTAEKVKEMLDKEAREIRALEGG